MTREEITTTAANTPLRALFKKYPYTENFFAAARIDVLDDDMTALELIRTVPDAYLADYGYTRAGFLAQIAEFIAETENHPETPVRGIASLTILGGRDKSGNQEETEITIRRGEIISIVGPTGSGKSRLLEDIESLAQRDTPTNRQILVEGKEPDDDLRYHLENRLVAQLTQNMNFVMDVSAEEFIRLHAESRGVPEAEIADLCERILSCANALAGEQFTAQTALTQLSGGQSRALMIADTALLSESPVILIDEIENAGIDKKKALELLSDNGKIILMATHDPVLALSGNGRIVIENGGIRKFIPASAEERALLGVLSALDETMSRLKNRIRAGEVLGEEVRELFPQPSKIRTKEEF